MQISSCRIKRFLGMESASTGDRAEDTLDLSMWRTPQNASRLRRSGFFKPGKVFAVAVLGRGPAGQTTGSTTDAVNGPLGENTYVHIRRMVVIRSGHGYCWCITISTYDGRGLFKAGFTQTDVDAHAIIYDSKKQPVCLKLGALVEPQSTKRPIAVEMTDLQDTIDPSSRLHLGRPFTVEHNSKVKEVGKVVDKDLKTLIAYVKNELGI